MPYPATAKTLQQWQQQLDQMAIQLKIRANQQKDASLAGSLNMESVKGFFDLLVDANNFFIEVATVPGIAAYVTQQKQGQSADPVADFNAMKNAVVNTLNWLRANVPSGVYNTVTYRLAYLFPADNVTQSSLLTFTAAQTAGYRTVLDALTATIS